MDDLSKLSAGLGEAPADGGDPSALVGLTGAIEQSGGLDGLLGQLRQAGLGDQVDSWIGTGQNAAVEPQQLGSALGSDTMQQLSAGSGLDIASLLPMLAMFLPQIIDMLTPDGNVPAGGLDQAAQNGLPDLGGLLGGLLGGGAAGSGASGTSPGLDDSLSSLGGDKGR